MTLAAGDGRATVRFSVRDAVSHVVQGSDDIVVDTHAPIVRLRRSAVRAPAGAVVTFSATASSDPVPAGVKVASGLRPGSFRWRFGDGLPGGITATPVHVFPRGGVYCGVATVRDRAGNVGRAEFTSRIGLRGATEVMGAARTMGRSAGGRVRSRPASRRGRGCGSRSPTRRGSTTHGPYGVRA